MTAVTFAAVVATWAMRAFAHPATVAVIFAALVSASSQAIRSAVVERQRWLASGGERETLVREGCIVEGFASRRLSAWKRQTGTLMLTDRRIAFQSLVARDEMLDLPLASIRAVRAIRGLHDGLVFETDRGRSAIRVVDPDPWVASIREALERRQISNR